VITFKTREPAAVAEAINAVRAQVPGPVREHLKCHTSPLPDGTLALVWEARLAGSPESVCQFRAMARAASATPYQAEAAALCVSELVTNAIVHSRSGQVGGTVAVTICPTATPGELRISVTDGGGPPRVKAWLAADGPGMLAACPDAWPVPPEHGYGLAIVDTVAADWGRFQDGNGFVTWCEIPEAAL
jgi:anti-sigma regulatory factor (Ser/Thr protein kinase)